MLQSHIYNYLSNYKINIQNYKKQIYLFPHICVELRNKCNKICAELRNKCNKIVRGIQNYKRQIYLFPHICAELRNKRQQNSKRLKHRDLNI